MMTTLEGGGGIVIAEMTRRVGIKTGVTAGGGTKIEMGTVGRTMIAGVRGAAAEMGAGIVIARTSRGGTVATVVGTGTSLAESGW